VVSCCKNSQFKICIECNFWNGHFKIWVTLWLAWFEESSSFQHLTTSDRPPCRLPNEGGRRQAISDVKPFPWLRFLVCLSLFVSNHAAIRSLRARQRKWEWPQNACLRALFDYLLTNCGERDKKCRRVIRRYERTVTFASCKEPFLVQCGPPFSCYKHELIAHSTCNKPVLPSLPSLSRKLLMKISVLLCDAVWFGRWASALAPGMVTSYSV